MLELKITEEYLNELINFSAKKCIGIILKRIDILEDRKALKDVVKECIYEQHRNIKDLIKAYNRGEELTIYKFNETKKAD